MSCAPQMTVDDAKSVKFFRHRREEINVFEMHTQLEELKASLATMQAVVTKTKNDVDTKVTADIKKLQEATTIGIKVATDAAASAKSDVAAAVKKVTTDVAGSISKAATATATKLNAAANNTAASLKTAASATDTKLAAMKKTVDATASKTDLATAVQNPPVHMWSGGPKGNNRGAGWAEYDLSRVDYDTAAPFFQRISNTRFRALRSGLFSYEVDSMAHTSARGWKHFRFFVDNTHVNGNTHFYTHSWYVGSAKSCRA